MILYINTTNNSFIEIFLKSNKENVIKKKFESRLLQAEKLLPQIKEMLKEICVNLSDLAEIRVNSTGSSFTALRIGIVTANTLAYALGIPIKNFAEKSEIIQDVEMVKPEYSREPDITLPKMR